MYTCARRAQNAELRMQLAAAVGKLPPGSTVIPPTSLLLLSHSSGAAATPHDVVNNKATEKSKNIGKGDKVAGGAAIHAFVSAPGQSLFQAYNGRCWSVEVSAVVLMLLSVLAYMWAEDALLGRQTGAGVGVA
jgi:hypothetical protein